MCPVPRIKLHLEIDHFLQQVKSLKCFFFYRSFRHTIKVIIMTGIPLWHGKMFRPVGLMVKDRSFFPESSFRRNCQNRNLFLLE